MRLIKSFTSSKDDLKWEANKKHLESKLAVGSVITKYQLREKAPHEKFDNQSVWLIIFYTKDGVDFKTVQSHKNNQYLRIEA